MKSRTAPCAAALVAAAGLLGSGPAQAANAGPPLAVIVEGPHADEVAGLLSDKLGGESDGEADAFHNALRSGGVLPLRTALTSKNREAQLVARARTIAKTRHVDRVLLVDLHWTPHGTRVHVWAVDPQHATPVVDNELLLAASPSAAEQTRAILGVLPVPPPPADPPPSAAPVSAAAPVEAPAPTPEPSTSEGLDPDRAVPPPPADGARSLLKAEAEVGVGMRHFSYVDRITPTLRPYDLGAAPLASLTATVFPFGSMQVPVLKDFGFTGDYARAFALSSQDSSGNSVGTTWQSFDVGVIERIPLTRALLANVTVAYGGDDFQFDQSLPTTNAALPSVSYRFIRIGAEARLTPLPSLSAFAGGSYLDMLSTGYEGTLFPRESVGGIEAHLGASYALTHSWELSLRGEYTRVFYSMNPVPGDTGVAGGALDEQTRVMAGIAYRM
jgi:hypothetical protein